MIEQTLVLIKPDGLLKSLTGNILTTLSETKLDIVGAKIVQVSDELAEKHYEQHKNKPFFEELKKYIKGELHNKRKVLALVYCGENAVQKIKELAGDTNPEKAYHLSIRGKYGRVLTSGVFENVIHASAVPKEAEQEIKLWFKPEELITRIYPTKIESLTKQELVWQ